MAEKREPTDGVVAGYGKINGRPVYAYAQDRTVLAGTVGAALTLIIGLALMGLTYGPLGTVLSELFPTPVRYTGSSLTFNLAGIVGASLAPYIAMYLATNYGLPWVGYYLTAAAVLTLIGLFATRETSGVDLHAR